MTQEDPTDIDRLADKLAAFKAEAEGPSEAAAKRSGSAMGQGMRLGIEMLAGILVGLGFGWLIDDWLGTKPWFMLGLMLLGLAGAMRNVMRAGSAMMAEDESEK